MNCFACGAGVDNGLALCDLCQRKGSVVLEFLPIYFRNLARWRPGRAGARPVPGSRVLYDGEIRGDGTGDRISDRLDEAANMLTTWARVMADARPYIGTLLDRLTRARRNETIDEAEMVEWVCRGFHKYLTSVATQDWCGDFIHDLAKHEAVLRGLTESSVPGWYAGACQRCEASTYVVPGLTWVSCGSCGATTYARDHLETILREARGWTARPMRLAEAVVALVDTEMSVPKLYERIKKWEQRGRIDSVQHVGRDYTWSGEAGRMVVTDQAVGPKRYRLGEVLDLVFAEGATRLRGEVSSAVA